MLEATLKPTDLPTPPRVAMQLIQACAKDDCSNATLGELAARDAALTAEALRIVNSAWYGFSQEVRTVAHAAVILGQRALRNLVLCIAVRDTLSGVRIENFDSAGFSEDTLRRAVAARLLAVEVGADADDAFTAGLLQDFGLLALYFLHPQAKIPWDKLRVCDPDERLRQEQKIFPQGHDQLGGQVAEQWQLPDDLAGAIGAHHGGAEDDLPPLARLLQCADWLAAVYEVDERGTCLARCREVLAERLALAPERVDDCLDRLPRELAEAARDLGVSAGTQPTFAELMRDANATLAEENLSYQELTMRLQHTLRERDRLAEELDRELELARDIQRALLPGTKPPDFPVAGLNVSARQLSGDFYDYFALPDGRIFFCLGDVAGKGTNAAILMAKVASLCRCLVRRGTPLAEMLDTVNREIAETSAHGMFVTLACGLLRADNGALEFANAGHLPALLLRAGSKPELMQASGPPLGVVDDTVYQVTRHDGRRARVYLFSDGVTESRDADGEELGLAGLLRMLLATWTRPPARQLELIARALQADGRAAPDDLTLLRVSLD